MIADQLSDVQLAGLVHMAPLKLASEQWMEDAHPPRKLRSPPTVGSVCSKELGGKLSTETPGLVASVTALDGRHGNKGPIQRLAVRCKRGHFKSYAFERPDLRCRALDLHPDFILDDAEAAERIERDLFRLRGEVEVGAGIGGRRWALVAFAEDLVEEVQPLAAEDTWLVSGGGSGVDGGLYHRRGSSQSEGGCTFSNFSGVQR